MKPFSEPARDSYDVVVLGGAIMGSSAAFHVVSDPGFAGSIAVIERDPSYRTSATALSNSCIRLQFSDPLNIALSRHGVAAIRDFAAAAGDARVPPIQFDDFGYLYLAADDEGAATLADRAALQVAEGAATRHMTPGEVARKWPFLATADLTAANWGARDEGYFDGGTMFEWWRRLGAERGAHYVAGEVVGIDVSRNRINGVRLADGTRIGCRRLVVAAGPRSGAVAGLVGRDLPVVPRKRWSFVFRAETPLPAPLPLVIDPSGIHVRSDGPAQYLAGCRPDDDVPRDADDFSGDDAIWEDRVWPLLAQRIPAFEAIRRVTQWIGHYDYNTFDQNAVVGPDPELDGLVWMTGFSGHGLQHAAAVGRGMAELLVHGGYRTLDLSPFGMERLVENRPMVERAVI